MLDSTESTHLEDEALEYSEGSGSCCMEAEDDIIQLYRINPSWMTQKVLFLQ